MTEPESLAVIDEEFDRRVGAATEHEDRALEGVFVEDHPTPLGQPVDPGPKIHRLNGHQHPHLRGNRDHGVPQKAAHSGVSALKPAPCKLTCIVWPCPF